MNIKGGPGWFYGGLIVVRSAWILHGFLQAILAACVTACQLAVYTRFAARRQRVCRRSKSLIFTLAMTVFVLVLLMFAFGAMLTEAHAPLLRSPPRTIRTGPQWLENAPLVAVARRSLVNSAFPGALDLGAADRRGRASCVGARLTPWFGTRSSSLFTILLLSSYISKVNRWRRGSGESFVAA
jgi:predicted PurR-regulated permease PerM